MTTMAKHVTKGLYFSTMDQRYSDLGNRGVILDDLRAGREIAELGSLAAAPLELEEIISGAIPFTTDPIKKRQNHLNVHWFGRAETPENDSYPPGNDPTLDSSSTGWWKNWNGDAQATMRCALIRSLEMAMGIGHWCPLHGKAGQPPAGHKADRARAKFDLPIDFYWLCGVTRFEAHIYRNHAQVTCIFVTPGFAYKIVDYTPDDPDELDEHVIAADGGPHRPKPISVFVGQHEDIEKARTHKYPVTMRPGVITHHMDVHIGGSSKSFP
jgi:hypothetical protein